MNAGKFCHCFAALVLAVQFVFILLVPAMRLLNDKGAAH